MTSARASRTTITTWPGITREINRARRARSEAAAAVRAAKRTFLATELMANGRVAAGPRKTSGT
ncbi:MAG: hypothetical protein M3010_02935 [Candidatus Dormibacteraeota bacterium]|nr:hypothetical protein [Candidatus Dormibacteraeota bacterium]